MRPPEEVKLRILGEWVHKAQADMAAADRLVCDEAMLSGAVAFHCQQAAEKLIKAFLVWSEVDFPKTHDLKQLLALASRTNEELAATLQEATALTPYGVELRYPGDRPDATPAQAQEALVLARLVRDKVLPLLPELPRAER